MTLAPDSLGPTVTIGEILVEIAATTRGTGFRAPQPLTGPYPSGAPAIFIDQCVRIGGTAAMVGAVGSDDFGRLTLDRLLRDGANVPVIEQAVAPVRSRGGSLSLDPNLRRELRRDADTGARFAALVDASDLLLPSGDELLQTAGETSEAAAIAALFARGVGEIAVKHGARGASVFYPDGRRTDAPAYAIDEIDPTGAGDCFGGAHFACRRLGQSVGAALTYACAAGARNVTVPGPMEGAGTRAELDAFSAVTPTR